jgi:hypothetical protein
LGTITAYFHPAYNNVKLAVALNLAFQTVEEITFKFFNLAAAQAGHVQVVTLRSAFIEVLFALEVHEVEFVDQAVALQQLQRSVNRYPVNGGIEFSGFPEQLAGVEVLLGGFNHAENGSPLSGHADAPRH